MATTIGFVTSIFGGRAGLFVARLQTAAGALDVQVSDLDGEPERFQERLLKTRIFREAMDLAEPVEVTYFAAEAGGNEVDDVRRITRDGHHTGSSASTVRGFVKALELEERDLPQSGAEPSDHASVAILDPIADVVHDLRLSMQMPERGVSAALFELLEGARRRGDVVDVRAWTGSSAKGAAAGNVQKPWIFAAEIVSSSSAETAIDGFVESIGIRLVRDMTLAELLFRTAPRLVDEGRLVDPAPFRPTLVGAMVPREAPVVRLLEHALRDGLRVRFGVAAAQRRIDDRPGGAVRSASKEGAADAGFETGLVAGAEITGSWSPQSAWSGYTTDGADPAGKNAPFGLLVGAVVMAPLASAARPVWLWVHQESLEAPPAPQCVPGLPLSDLGRLGSGFLQVAYGAAWEGEGCFNHGVYRIQVITPTPPKIYVDGKELPCGVCRPWDSPGSSKDSPAPAPAVFGEGVTAPAYRKQEPARKEGPALQVCMAHACLEGLHTIRVVLDEWRCSYRFLFDVFKIQ